MIDISKLTEADKGREVRYQYRQAAAGYEIGRITSWNYRFVFVRYSRRVTPCRLDETITLPINRPNSEATRPEDLEWL